MQARSPHEAESADTRIRRMMESHGTALLRMCYLYLRDERLAEDAVQECFFKAYRKLDTFRGESAEKTWLMRIAINTCKDMRRSAWHRLVDRRVSLDGVEAAQDASPKDDTVLCEVMRLPPKDREVVLLRYYQQLSIGEIGEALGVPTGTVNSRLNRARQKLRHRLEGWYFDEGEL